MIMVLTAASFASGSLMFSYWLGRLSNKNLKDVGDGNPGALNLWKAKGYKFGLLGIVLDCLKGYLPLLFLLGSGYGKGYFLIPLALAPIAGHAFSPFLKGRGGKAIAVTFGVWSALTSFEASLAYAIILGVMTGVTRLIRNKPKTKDIDGLQVVSGMLLLTIYLYVRMFSAAIVWVGLGNLIILIYTHRFELLGWLRRGYSHSD